MENRNNIEHLGFFVKTYVATWRACSWKNSEIKPLPTKLNLRNQLEFNFLFPKQHRNAKSSNLNLFPNYASDILINAHIKNSPHNDGSLHDFDCPSDKITNDTELLNLTTTLYALILSSIRKPLLFLCSLTGYRDTPEIIKISEPLYSVAGWLHRIYCLKITVSQGQSK